MRDPNQPKRKHHAKQSIVVLAAALIAGACSGGSETSPTTTSNTAPPASATSAPADSTATTDTATTTTSTSTTSTTLAPTTTVDPLIDIERLVQTALIEGEAALTTAFEDPSSAAGRDGLLPYFAEGSLDKILGALDDLAERGLVAIDNPDFPQVVQVQSAPVFLDTSDSSRVEARVCRVDAGIVLQPPKEPGGQEVIVDDTVNRVIAISDFLFEDGHWKLAGGRELTSTVGDTTCDV